LKKVDHFDKIVLKRSEFSEVDKIKEKISECISYKVDLKFECERCRKHKDIKGIFGVTETYYLRCKECRLRPGEDFYFSWIMRKGKYHIIVTMLWIIKEYECKLSTDVLRYVICPFIPKDE